MTDTHSISSLVALHSPSSIYSLRFLSPSLSPFVSLYSCRPPWKSLRVCNQVLIPPKLDERLKELSWFGVFFFSVVARNPTTDKHPSAHITRYKDVQMEHGDKSRLSEQTVFQQLIISPPIQSLTRAAARLRGAAVSFVSFVSFPQTSSSSRPKR